MGIHSRGGVACAIRHALASVLVFAQVLLVFTPLVELREAAPGARTITAGSVRPDAPSIAAPHGHAAPHNAATCPACIAQSLHAQLVEAVRLPTTIIAGQTPADIRNDVFRHHDPPSTHRSRAPPHLS